MIRPLLLGTMILIWCCSLSRAQMPATPLKPPSSQALAESTKLISGVYMKQMEAAKSRSQKQALASKLLDDAQQAQDDPATMYALCHMSRNIAMGVGDVSIALRSIDQMATVFEVKLGAEKLALFEQIAPRVKTAEDYYYLARYLDRELNSVVKVNEFVEALSLTEKGLTAAKKAKEPDLIKQWTRKQELLTAQAKAWKVAGAALQTLETKPVDRNANAIAGKYTCYFQEDWKFGLPMLAIGDDKSAAVIAEREIRGTAGSAQQLLLADAWYDYSMTQSDLIKLAIQRHAAKLYKDLLPYLKAIVLRRVENRIAEIDATNSLFRKDEWVEILDYVKLPEHLVAHKWQREELVLVCQDEANEATFRIPIELSGDFELRIRGTRLSGKSGFGITLSHPVNDGAFVFSSHDGTISGISNILGKFANDNASQTKMTPLPIGRLFQLDIRVATRDDQTQISSLLDNLPHTTWTGPTSSITRSNPAWKGALHLRHFRSAIAIQSVQLKVKSGAATLVD